VDELNYFSLDPAGDVSVSGSQGGFSYASSTNPASLPGANLTYGIDYDFIGSSGVQLVAVPEPSSLVLALIGTLTLLVVGCLPSRGRQ
jgi:hypothetical protein